MVDVASGIYHPRKSMDSPLWNVLNNHYDDFEKHYNVYLARQKLWRRKNILARIAEMFREEEIYSESEVNTVLMQVWD